MDRTSEQLRKMQLEITILKRKLAGIEDKEQLIEQLEKHQRAMQHRINVLEQRMGHIVGKRKKLHEKAKKH